MHAGFWPRVGGKHAAPAPVLDLVHVGPGRRDTVHVVVHHEFRFSIALAFVFGRCKGLDAHAAGVLGQFSEEQQGVSSADVVEVEFVTVLKLHGLGNNGSVGHHPGSAFDGSCAVHVVVGLATFAFAEGPFRQRFCERTEADAAVWSCDACIDGGNAHVVNHAAEVVTVCTGSMASNHKVLARKSGLVAIV